MDRRKFPGTPDDALPVQIAQPEISRPSEQELAQQVPFGAIPGLLRLAPNPLIDVTHDDVRRITTSNITRCIYASEGLRTVDRVALNPSEYGKIAIHPPRLLERAEAAASRKYQHANPILRREHELDRRRDTATEFSTKQTLIIEGLDSEIKNLGTLIKYAKTPNMRRATNVATRLMANSAWGSITNMLEVVGDRQNWTPQARESTQEAMLRALTTGPTRVRMAEWRRVLPMAYDYARRKRFVFTERTETITALGNQAAQELTALLDSYGFVQE